VLSVVGRIGAYELVRELGRGGMGVVYEARSPEGGAVAIKLLLTASSGQAADRFDRERRLLAALGESDGFVPLLDAGMSPQGPFLVMALVTGGTLRDRLEGTGLPIREVVELGTTLARALGRAHALGIVHRDLKPENILYTANGRPLISDLGLGKHFDENAPGMSRSIALSKTGVALGTPGFLSPEQLNDAKSAGPPADVFALGTILYEAATGMAAFGGDTAHARFAAVATGARKPIRAVRSDVPRWLARIVERALAQAPGDRYPDGAALARALEAGDDGSGVRRALIASIAVIALAGVVVSLPRRHESSSAPTTPPSRSCEALVLDPVRPWKSGTVNVTGTAVGAKSVRFALVVDGVPSQPVDRPVDESGRVTAALPVETKLPKSLAIRAEAGASGPSATLVVPLDPWVSFQIGSAYFNGSWGFPEDEVAAFDSVRRTAESGHVPSLARLGILLRGGIGCARDDARAESCFARSVGPLREQARAGDPLAQFMLGRMLEKGRGVPADRAEAVRWMRKAAEAGEVGAMTDLAVLCREGRGTPADEADAFRWFQKAAACGDARAMFYLGMTFNRGIGRPKDEVEALKWHRLAAEGGNAAAMNNLAVMLASGRGAPEDKAQAVQWYRKAAERGEVYAMTNLATHLSRRGTPQDDAQAFQWYLKAAKRGHGPAMLRVARAYEQGIGVAPNGEEASSWFHKAAAAEARHSPAAEGMQDVPRQDR
jgi:TPR repeat protein